MMKKYEGNTLEEACAQACNDLNCLISELEYNIVQYPSKGFLGLFAKKAIIVALNKSSVKKDDEEIKSPKEADIATAELKEDIDNSEQEEPKEEQKVEEIIEPKEDTEISVSNEIVDSFFSKTATKKSAKYLEKESIDAPTLEEKIKKLLSHSCFEIDTVEVDIEDNTAYVFIDGEDAALLIGKEGYRYNALSYILFNWINTNYGLYLKLEIAQFLASQQDMIKHQMQPVVEHIKREGWGKTRELNGILVQIALEYLRDTFPNKYVAIKRAKNGERYIVINEFNKKDAQ